MKIIMIVFVPINIYIYIYVCVCVCMCASHYVCDTILQHISINNIYYIYIYEHCINNACGIGNGMLLHTLRVRLTFFYTCMYTCRFFVVVVIHVWHPHFPLNGIRSTRLDQVSRCNGKICC